MIVQLPKQRKSYKLEPKVDGGAVKAVELRGDKLFIVLPALSSGKHELIVPLK